MILEDLKDKKVLVTGSSSGIGAATAIMFAQQGSFVGVHYFRTQAGGEKTLAEVLKHSRGCLLKADMREEDQVKQLIDDFVSAAGGIDILINNAGTLLDRRDIEGMDVEFFDDLFATNVRSTFLATKHALEYLKTSAGSIVNIGSVAAHTGGGGGSGVYAAAKAAVHTLTIAMTKEFAKYNIRVNTVSPGLIETRFHDLFSTPERRKSIAESTPLKRNGTAEDIAKAILFLASRQTSEFVNGEYLAVNGGQHLRT